MASRNRARAAGLRRSASVSAWHIRDSPPVAISTAVAPTPAARSSASSKGSSSTESVKSASSTLAAALDRAHDGGPEQVAAHGEVEEDRRQHVDDRGRRQQTPVDLVAVRVRLEKADRKRELARRRQQ